MNVAMSMRLSDDVTRRVARDLSLKIADCRDAILHRDIHLIGRHPKVVVVLEIVYRSTVKQYEQKHISLLFSEVIMAKGSRQFGSLERC